MHLHCPRLSYYEVSTNAAKFGKQIKYAEARRCSVRVVHFLGWSGAPVHEVKDIRSGEQVAADPASWMPPAEVLRCVQIVRAEGLK